MYQTTWHGIDLLQFPAAVAARDKPASPEFFAQFYAALEAGQGKTDPAWVESKRNLGEVISRELIKPWQQRAGKSPRVLAMAVGKGIVEGVWAEHGYQVTFNECQESSLVKLRQQFSQAKFLVGDARTLQPEGKFDIITVIGLDYCMNRNELASFMTLVSPWLEADGEIILCCMNRITWRRLLAEIYKKCTGYYRRVRHVFWGYWRSLSEFFHVARAANLQVSQVYRFGGPTGLIPQSAWKRALFPRNDPNVLIVFTKA